MSFRTSDSYLGRLLKQHYRGEVRGIHAAPSLWQKIEPCLGAQEKPWPVERVVGAIAGHRQCAPRCSRTIGYVLAAGCLLAGAVLAAHLAAWQRGGSSATDLTLGSAQTTPGGPRVDKTPLRVYALSPGNATPGGPTAAPQAAAPTPAAQAVPALSVGTLDEAGKAIGVDIVLPSYLPTGAEREEDVVRYQAQDGRGYVSVGYRVGTSYLAVSYLTTLVSELPLPEGESVTVGPFEAVVSTQAREPSDPLPPVSEVVWRDGDALVRVGGDLPVAELLKVARSLYP